MTRALSATALLSIAFLAPLSGTPTGASSDPPLQIADLAWERGDYPAALAGYLRLLDSPDAASVLEPIALRTGELYATTELTRDGALPQFSPDGRYLLYETGPIATRVIRVVATAAPDRVVVELRGGGAAFSPTAGKSSTGSRWRRPAGPASNDRNAGNDGGAGAGCDVAARATIHALDTGQETSLDTGTLSAATLAIGAGDTVIFAAGPATPGPTQIHAVGSGRPLTALTADPTEKIVGAINSTGTALIFTTRVPARAAGAVAARAPVVLRQPAAVSQHPAPRQRPSLPLRQDAAPPRRRRRPRSTCCRFRMADRHDHRQLAVLLARRQHDRVRAVAPRTKPACSPSPQPIRRRRRRSCARDPSASTSPPCRPTRHRVAFQMMTRDDWEIVVVNRDGTSESRVTRDIQHDLLPLFLSETRLLGVIGEPRHRRSFLYDLEAGSRTRLFHNNTVRTIAPEYLVEGRARTAPRCSSPPSATATPSRSSAAST